MPVKLSWPFQNKTSPEQMIIFSTDLIAAKENTANHQLLLLTQWSRVYIKCTHQVSN
jgi:hypothetical protein